MPSKAGGVSVWMYVCVWVCTQQHKGIASETKASLARNYAMKKDFPNRSESSETKTPKKTAHTKLTGTEQQHGQLFSHL